MQSVFPMTKWRYFEGFGFCEFLNPDSALRAIRLLHDKEIGGNPLVVKADSKSNALLDQYKGMTFTYD